SLASAHFQLQCPTPRGVFQDDTEELFCDGPSAATDRTLSPLNGGFYSLHSQQTDWTAAVWISFEEQPTELEDFFTVVPMFKASGTGTFCLNLDLLQALNDANLRDGHNATLAVGFDGENGDRYLYQCADITLSTNATLPA
ncbi:hypothetical protein C8R47DRAFT_915551, partial [Mycena vitilis]